MRRIAHIVNPVIVGEESDLLVAQPVTFKSMVTARDFARGQVEVELFSAQYPEDRLLVPAGFRATPDLDRSVLDIGTFRVRRKLPLLSDILDRLYDATEAEWLIYTNVDIALMPHFYLAVDALIGSGYDAFTINRRSISKAYTRPAELPLMAAQVGEPHPGHDCFVFARAVYPDYDLGSACIGAGRVGAILMLNQIYHARRFEEFKDLHLTFHIGSDRVHRSPELADYFAHNESQLRKIIKYLNVIENALDHPYVQRLIRRYGPRSVSERVRAKFRRGPQRLATLISRFRP